MVERIEVNLLPAEYRVRARRLYLRREIVYPLLLLAIVMTVLGLWMLTLNSEIGQYETQIAQIDENIRRNQHILKEIRELEEEKKLVTDKIMGLERIDVNREKWVRLQEELCKHLPDLTWLVQVIEKPPDPVLEIRGSTFSFPEVATYMSRLAGSEYIDRVDLTSIIQQSGSPGNVYVFTITCRINPNARMGNMAGVTGASDAPKKTEAQS